MAASFPTSIKSYTTKVDDVDDVLASDINSVQEEIVAIETALGASMATAQLIRGWCVFDTAGTIADSHNVDSVTDTATGRWTVNWTTDFATANYAVAGLIKESGASDYNLIIESIAAGSVALKITDGGGSGVDRNVVMMAIGDR